MSDTLLSQLHEFLRPAGADYAVCGGHAIDLFIGRQTRPHKDLDAAVYWEDRDAVIRFMFGQGWVVFEPCGGGVIHHIADIASQKKVKRNLFCLKSMETEWCLSIKPLGGGMYQAEDRAFIQTELDFIEFLFNRRENNRFFYARSHDVSRAMDKALLYSGEIPYLAPEIALLYKSTALENPDYRHDFDISLPLLDDERKAWLRGALKTMNPDGHGWLKRMEG